jgi:hypothetical protein
MGPGGKYFLVPAAEYPNASIVIDLKRHAEAETFIQTLNTPSAKGPIGQAAGGGEKVAEKPAGELGIALPWSEVIRKIEATGRRG